MSGPLTRGSVIGVAMFIAAGLAIAVTPTTRMADLRGVIDLETVVPKEFGDWTIDSTIVPIQVSPDVQANLDRIYDGVLARTYVNSKGERIMLSIAYGGEQSRNLQLHRPEVCYAAQGFAVSEGRLETLNAGALQIPVKKTTARQGPRNEPITYWMRVGDRIALTGLDQAIARYRYGLTGLVPDGLLVRVSSISGDEPAAFKLQEEFVANLVTALNTEAKARLLGTLP